MIGPDKKTTKTNERQPRETLTDPAKRHTLIAQGGMAATTNLVTVDGITPVSDLNPGDKVYALDPTMKRVKCKPVTAVRTVTPENPLVEIETERANLHVAPEQPVPFCTKEID